MKPVLIRFADGTYTHSGHLMVFRIQEPHISHHTHYGGIDSITVLSQPMDENGHGDEPDECDADDRQIVEQGVPDDLPGGPLFSHDELSPQNGRATATTRSWTRENG